jgi:hypothetical protein
MINSIEYKEACANLEKSKIKFDLPKIDKTLELTLRFLTEAGAILIIDGAIRRLRWYDFRTLAKLARLAYDFIVKLYEIWKE